MENGVNVDIVHNSGKFTGNVAARLLQSGFKASALRTNDVLRNRDWILVDQAVVAVARQRLVAVGDLLTRGLSFPIADALGVTKVEWQQVSDMGPADVNMSGVAEGVNDRVQYNLNSIPIPIVHKDFSINIRALEAARRNNHPLDVTQVELATRIVSEKIENMLFNGGGTFGTNGTIYGLTNAPNAQTGSMTAPWQTSTTTGNQIVTDLLSMISKLQTVNMFGPYMLYVPVAAYIHMGDDFKAASDRTIIERLKATPGIIDVRPSANITNKVILVQMTKDVLDMIDGIQPTAVSWESHGGMVVNFKVLSILVPRMKTDMNTQTGICIFS